MRLQIFPTQNNLFFCIRYVDEELSSHEEFIGLHSLPCTTSATITHTIEDILLRLSLQLDNCRGQCYDGASSIAGCRTGVATTILKKQPLAIYTHCYGHALNLAVQDSVKANHVLRDTLDTVEEMTKLIKKSPKREAIFKHLKNEIACESPGIRLLAPTRWTVRAAALTSISENYPLLRETWSEAKQHCSESEMCARIGGVARQMETYEFFFGVELGHTVLNMADNLSATLQGSTVSASEGKHIMNMTVKTLESMRSEEAFSLFCTKTKEKAQKLDLDEPKQPRQRKAPRRLEVGTSSTSDAPTSAEAFYRRTYYEVVDYVTQAIRSRFDQTGYKTLDQMERLLIEEQVNTDEFSGLLSAYGKELDKDRLAAQLRVLHRNIPLDIQQEKGGIKLKSILNFLCCLSPAERQFYSNVVHLAKLILVMPATNAISERSFSALRRLKTWLRSTMQPSRLNWCMVLHVHNEETDQLDLTTIANDFVSRNDSRQSIFGKFV